MKRLHLDSHEQKILLRKVFSIFERDPVLEYFKLRIEKHGAEHFLLATGQRGEKEFSAKAEGADFAEVVQHLREQLLDQLPRRAEPRLRPEEPLSPAPFF